MKKIALLLVLTMLLTLAACTPKDTGAKADEKPAVAPTEDNTSTATDIPAAPTEPAAPVEEKAEEPESTFHGGPEAPFDPTETTVADELFPEENSEAAGGWTHTSAVGTPLDEELAQLFTDATAGMMGANHEALGLLGTQVVAGTNYAFLAKTTLVTNPPVVKLTVIIIYKALDGTVSLLSVNDFDPSAYTASEAASGAMGGWHVAEQADAGLPEDTQKTFDSAMETLLGVGYKPVALLGTQVVAGVNYLYLAAATTVTAEPVTTLKLVTVYKALDGSCTATDIVDFNIADFNG